MPQLIHTVRTAHDRFSSICSRGTSALLLLIRLYWGWQFATDGWAKLHHLDRVGQFFATLNLPMPAQTALFVSLLEFVGGQIHRSVLCQREYAPDQDASQMPIQRCLTALMLANERKHLMDKAKT